MHLFIKSSSCHVNFLLPRTLHVLLILLLLLCFISPVLLLSRTGGSNNIFALPPLWLRRSTATRRLRALGLLTRHGIHIRSSRRRRSFSKWITSRGSQALRVKSRQRGRRLLKGQRALGLRLAAGRGQVEVARLAGDGVLVHVFGAVTFVGEEGFFHKEGVEEGVVCGGSAAGLGAGFVGSCRTGKTIGEGSGGSRGGIVGCTASRTSASGWLGGSDVAATDGGSPVGYFVY